MAFLHENILQEFGKRAIAQTVVPNFILDNLKSGFGQRPYQIESFQRYILCHTEDFEGRPKKPFHLLYNMALVASKHIELKTNISIKKFLTQSKKISDARMLDKINNKEITIRTKYTSQIENFIKVLKLPH